MTPELRAAIAAVCIADTRGGPVSAIYDHEAGAWRGFEVEAVAGRVACCDRKTGETLGGDLPELWHAASDAWIHVEAKGEGAYEGHDRGSSADFAVRVSGIVAHFFEHERPAWEAYTAQLPAGAF
jgi:hypothetical protein